MRVLVPFFLINKGMFTKWILPLEKSTAEYAAEIVSMPPDFCHVCISLSISADFDMVWGPNYPHLTLIIIFVNFPQCGLQITVFLCIFCFGICVKNM